VAKSSGGLSRWFKEEWVDLSRPKKGGGFEPCGRPDADEGKYPKCVPKATAMKMTQAEIDSAVRRKRRAESTQDRKGKKPINVPTEVEKHAEHDQKDHGKWAASNQRKYKGKVVSNPKPFAGTGKKVEEGYEARPLPEVGDRIGIHLDLTGAESELGPGVAFSIKMINKNGNPSYGTTQAHTLGVRLSDVGTHVSRSGLNGAVKRSSKNPHAAFTGKVEEWVNSREIPKGAAEIGYHIDLSKNPDGTPTQTVDTTGFWYVKDGTYRDFIGASDGIGIGGDLSEGGDKARTYVYGDVELGEVNPHVKKFFENRKLTKAHRLIHESRGRQRPFELAKHTTADHGPDDQREGKKPINVPTKVEKLSRPAILGEGGGVRLGKAAANDKIPYLNVTYAEVAAYLTLLDYLALDEYEQSGLSKHGEHDQSTHGSWAKRKLGGVAEQARQQYWTPKDIFYRVRNTPSKLKRKARRWFRANWKNVDTELGSPERKQLLRRKTIEHLQEVYGDDPEFNKPIPDSLRKDVDGVRLQMTTGKTVVEAIQAHAKASGQDVQRVKSGLLYTLVKYDPLGFRFDNLHASEIGMNLLALKPDVVSQLQEIERSTKSIIGNVAQMAMSESSPVAGMLERPETVEEFRARRAKTRARRG
jgi:hypothetical protein